MEPDDRKAQCLLTSHHKGPQYFTYLVSVELYPNCGALSVTFAQMTRNDWGYRHKRQGSIQSSSSVSLASEEPTAMAVRYITKRERKNILQSARGSHIAKCERKPELLYIY
ncbi:hypothetical protein K435DRAFT_800027 [Dendrothele bispora CBS 962.96]|uniref:Uncharacterized protein n=1 Tax=Dendrothele bispora (strain CBS 962.96) TaxID=1314807 RepID=A0A4V4HEZ8_DENBC|nr:hypothetical protein K435DRAFT_800027 [Dendrothele bispora CBS 962.96]